MLLPFEDTLQFGLTNMVANDTCNAITRHYDYTFPKGVLCGGSITLQDCGQTIVRDQQGNFIEIFQTDTMNSTLKSGMQEGLNGEKMNCGFICRLLTEAISFLVSKSLISRIKKGGTHAAFCLICEILRSGMGQAADMMGGNDRKKEQENTGN